MLIDSSFNNGGLAFVFDALELRNGSLLVSGGLFPPAIGSAQPLVARYSSMGQLDPTFGSGGLIFPAGSPSHLAELGDERVLAPSLLTPTGQSAIIAMMGRSSAFRSPTSRIN